MKTRLLSIWITLAFTFWGGMNSQAQNYQSTISDAVDRDHYSVVVSITNSSRHVLAGTEESSNGDTQLHILEVDANGIPVWEKRYSNIKDEQVFDIATRSGGYVITGYADNLGNDEIFVMLLGASGNIVQQNTFDAGVPGMESYGVHVIETEDDPVPGYLVTGFTLAGQGDSDSKQGIVMKLTNSLAVQWIVSMNSPASHNEDADLNGHGLEVPELGYFISGSTNGSYRLGNDYTEAQAVMLKYDGTVIWQKSYAGTFFGNTHRYVSTSAIYDPTTNEIFQLGNSTQSHVFFVNVFDANTGVTNSAKRVKFISNSNYNTQGFEIIESIDADNYCITGYLASAGWTSTEESTLGQSLWGSPVFLLEVQKATPNVLWDKQYNIPNTGFNSGSGDIFSAYSGIQTHIYTPNMILTKEDNTGFTLVTSRKNVGNSYFDIELLDLTAAGNNKCDSDKPVFNPYLIAMGEHSNTLFSSPNCIRSLSPVHPSPLSSNVGSCGSDIEICEANADFSFSAEDCKVDFTDLSSGLDLGCYEWDFGDGTTQSGVQNPSHMYTASGTYEVCLEVCCENANGTFSYSTYCEFVTVTCPVECEVPQLNDYFDFEIGEENCFQYFFEASTLSNPDLCYNWFVDGNLVGTGGIFNYTFAANLGYTICLETYCCEDPSVSNTYCEVIEVGCEQYTCGCSLIDLLPNGDFENLSIPVNSGLPTNCSCSYGSVCVGHEPRDKCMNPLWIDDLWDHTLGTSDGNFFIVDGINGVIWTDNVTVTGGTTYIFEFWEIREISDNSGNNSTQTFDIVINGSVIGSFNTASAPSNAWTKYCLEWTAGAGTSIAAIEIVQTSGTGYNDYGIDDIQFGLCEGAQFKPSINEVHSKFESFEVYPNPASTLLTIKMEGEFTSASAQILSPDGKLVKNVQVGSRSSFSLNVSDLVDGAYLIKIGEITKRFIVQR